MPRYRILGAHRDTGADIAQVITADTPDDAEAVAIGRGWLVSRVVEIEDAVRPDAPPAAACAAADGKRSQDEKIARIGCAIILILFVIVLPVSCVWWAASSPAAKHRAEERRVEQAARFADDGKQHDRRRIMDLAIATGVLDRITTPARYPHVIVGPAFSLMTYEDRVNLFGVIHAYYSIAAGESVIVSIRDRHTNNQIGTFDETGLHMRRDSR